MKQRNLLLAVIYLLSTIQLAMAQLKTNTNSTASPNKLAVVPCNPNTFWAVHFNPTNGDSANISEFTLANSTISNNGIILTTCPGMNMAYANMNFNNNSGGTFYAIDHFYYNTVNMYDGTNWIPLSPISNGVHFNIAGKGNILILDGWPTTNSNGGMKHFFKYSGISIDSIYYTGNNYSNACRSLTIDDDYNIWFFIGPDPFASPATYLCKIDTSGNLIQQYPLSQNSIFNSAETGSIFILNNTIYVGFQQGNPNYQNILMPFAIVNDSLVMGTPIPFNFPNVYLYDIKSCNQGTLTSISEVPESLKELSVYPDPAENQITVHLPYGSNRNAQLNIYNLQGKLIETKKASDTAPINCASWARGIYFVSLIEEGKAKVTRKIVVI